MDRLTRPTFLPPDMITPCMRVSWIFDHAGDARITPDLAIAACGGCPVRDACAEWAVEHDERWGIWGGLTPYDRLEMKRAS